MGNCCAPSAGKNEAAKELNFNDNAPGANAVAIPQVGCVTAMFLACQGVPDPAALAKAAPSVKVETLPSESQPSTTKSSEAGSKDFM